MQKQSMDEQLLNRLKGAAKKAAGHSYCPYSGFSVGAAVIGDDGNIYAGTNVENASYGLTICAERVAIFQAIASSVRVLRAILIYTPTAVPTAPCGSCRQVIRELGPDAEVICICGGPDSVRWSIAQLLPDSFGFESLLGSATPSSIVATPRDDRPRICIDIDNVIAQTDGVMRTVIRDVTGGRVDLEYEDVQCFNYWECRDRNGNSITKEDWKAVHAAFSEPRYVGSIEPVPGVQEHLNRLGERYMLHLATSRLPQARKTTIEWLERHRFPPHDLHFLKHGEKHISLGRFDASVEDDPAQACAFANAGFAMNFVIAHPWNTSISDAATLRRVSSWNEIIDMLCGSDQRRGGAMPPSALGASKARRAVRGE